VVLMLGLSHEGILIHRSMRLYLHVERCDALRCVACEPTLRGYASEHSPRDIVMVRCRGGTRACAGRRGRRRRW
jgi:hypothetical protein